MKYLKLLLSAYLLVIIYGCVRFPCGDELSCWVEYNIALEYESDPPIREISIGDSFIISIEIPHMVEDTETGEMYDLSGLNYYSDFSIAEMNLSDKTFQTGLFNSFEYSAIENKGDINVVQLGGFSEVVNLAYDTLENSRIVSFNVEAKTTGLFLEVSTSIQKT